MMNLYPKKSYNERWICIPKKVTMKDEFESKKVLQWKMNLNPKNVTMKGEFVFKKS